MEFAMLDELVAKAVEKGIKTIYGYYYKTAKNAMVSALYETFGFENVSREENGDSVWKLDTAGYTNKNRYIAVN
jgi:predicted enzyme involved in methoxymalonyl-ACP biosynthesis